MRVEAATGLVELVGERLGRDRDSMQWGQHAKALVHRLGDPPELEAPLRAKLGVIHTRHGRYDAALVALEQAIALDTLGGAVLSRYHRQLGNVHYRRGHYAYAQIAYARSIELGEAALARASSSRRPATSSPRPNRAPCTPVLATTSPPGSPRTRCLDVHAGPRACQLGTRRHHLAASLAPDRRGTVLAKSYGAPMNTWSPQQQPVRPEPQNHVALGVLIALAVVGAALALLTALDRRDTRDESTLGATVTELHDARIELQASAAELRTATATLQEAARTLERRATTVNILDMIPPDPPAPPVPPTPIALLPPDPALNFATAVDCAEEGRCTISRAELQRLLDNPAWLVRQARIIPSIKDGHSQGLKLYAIRGASFPGAIGFKNGDLLVSVNGRPMTDPESALAAYAALRTADTLKFAIQRKDEPRTLTLKIE